jgi:hypothetical protein
MIGIADEECLLHLQGCPFFHLQVDSSMHAAALSNKMDLFGLEISYDSGFEKGYFNGIISGIRWKSYRDNIQRAYGYHYDSLNGIRQS